MRAELHGPDGRHIVLEANNLDLDAFIERAEHLYRAVTGAPAAAPIGFSIPTERTAPEAPPVAEKADPTIDAGVAR
jgi:hypothetical protein